MGKLNKEACIDLIKQYDGQIDTVEGILHRMLTSRSDMFIRLSARRCEHYEVILKNGRPMTHYIKGKEVSFAGCHHKKWKKWVPACSIDQCPLL